ncbi:MAG: alpha/beta fold hydrolase [Methyloligellaceae bacterium]
MDQDLRAGERRDLARRERRAKPRPANREARAHRLRDGRRIGYAEYGDPEGFPVFAFHGTPGSRIMFRLADSFAALQGLRLIATDRPGYGLSSVTERWGMRPVVEDMATLADALGIDAFAVVGVSGGAPFAAACAAAHPDRVRAAAFVSPVGPVVDAARGPNLAPGHRLIFLRLAASERLSRAAFHLLRFFVARTPGLAHRCIQMLAAPSDVPILRRPEVRDDLINGLGEGMRPGIAGAVRDLRLFSQDWDFDPGLIGVPCCLWQGDADRTVPPAAAEGLAHRIPDCELRMLAGAGHYWIYDHFVDVLSWVTERCTLRTEQSLTP